MGSHRDFISLQLSSFAQKNNNLIVAVYNSIINPLFPLPKPSSIMILAYLIAGLEFISKIFFILLVFLYLIHPKC